MWCDLLGLGVSLGPVSEVSKAHAVLSEQRRGSTVAQPALSQTQQKVCLTNALDLSPSLLCFRDRVSLCSPGCPGTHSVDQAGLELTEIHLPLSSSVLGLKVCSTTAQPRCVS